MSYRSTNKYSSVWPKYFKLGFVSSKYSQISNFCHFLPNSTAFCDFFDESNSFLTAMQPFKPPVLSRLFTVVRDTGVDLLWLRSARICEAVNHLLSLHIICILTSSVFDVILGFSDCSLSFKQLELSKRFTVLWTSLYDIFNLLAIFRKGIWLSFLNVIIAF